LPPGGRAEGGPEMTVVSEETFGLVSPIITFSNIDETISISNGMASLIPLRSARCTA
jgi:acyl-CoA reductase-like NAD-dependent aldehyde dehydrogenase